MPKEEPPLPEPQPLRPASLGRILTYSLVLGAAILAAGAGVLWRWGRSPVPDMPGSLLTWSSLQEKQDLAAYLNRTVRQADFAVEVVSVKKRQSYWTLAKADKLTIKTIIGFNPDMEHLNAYVGRPVLLPNQRGTLHQVGAGQTPESIEQDYGLLSGTVRAANQVGWLGLRVGQVLFLPGAAPKQLTAPMQQLFAQRDFFRSPLAGHYTSMMGKRVDPFTGVIRFHNGVDIGAPFNSLVGAAADGTVVLAGWNDGFGKCIIIQHAQGYRTLYGHLNAILVHVGQKVKQHQLIGRVGMTGRTTGPHLHFTIWKNNRIQDPLKYLW
jgi:murein DD-endopeptidase MepM/ murein hydrolase activator NlpD